MRYGEMLHLYGVDAEEREEGVVEEEDLCRERVSWVQHRHHAKPAVGHEAWRHLLGDQREDGQRRAAKGSEGHGRSNMGR